MKFYVILLVMAVSMILVATALAGEEPYKAAVSEDTQIPPFYLSEKVLNFTHAETNYYASCGPFLECDPAKVDPTKCTVFGSCWSCPSRCVEKFKTDKAIDKPEVCCVPEKPCPNIANALVSKGNDGYFEWVIVLPKKPEGELNIEIECGILKPNAWEHFKALGNPYDSIKQCAAETGEILDFGFCTRKPGKYLKGYALPKITSMAFPGGQNDFVPFHLTAYKNPGTDTITRDPVTGDLSNSSSLQVLNGSRKSRIALKACMDKTILVKWPVEGEVNALGEDEDNLEAGDLIYVRMDIPPLNTVDIYCSKYSVTIGGIGEPPYVPDSSMPCRYDCGL